MGTSMAARGRATRRRCAAAVSAAAMVLLTGTATVTVASGSAAGAAGLSVFDDGQVLDVLPPTAGDRARYDALAHIDPATLTDASLPAYFRAADMFPDLSSFPPSAVQHPAPGVWIATGSDGVPHVYGTTDADVAWGAGYAGTLSHMFMQDVARHLGAGRLAELLGPAGLDLDAAQLRSVDYTPAEALAQAQAHPELWQLLLGYSAGITAAEHRLCPTATAGTCPLEYHLLGTVPANWQPADSLYALTVFAGRFGHGGGGELDNARFLEQLRADLGAAEGDATYADLRQADDPASPVTMTSPAPLGGPTGPVDPAAVALPDLSGPTAPGTGAQLPLAAPAQPAPSLPSATLDAIRSLTPGAHRDMSNALLVAGSRTADGHPIAVFGPQAGYFDPTLFVEEDLHGPTLLARGVSFVGTSMLVELGRGIDYAWSATSADGDDTDTVADRLCNTDGSPATVTSTGYLDGDACVPMTEVDHTESFHGAVVGRLLDLRTRHGIVQSRGTAGGVPVAWVRERSSYGDEGAAAVAFRAMNTPAIGTDPAAFDGAIRANMNLTFNWFYVDDASTDIVTSGRYPLRAAGVDPDLPRWGDPRWDPTGVVSPSLLPHQSVPASGFAASWNNRPAPGVVAADDNWGWGSVQRVQLLDERLAPLAARGGVTRAQVVAAMEDAATVDLRAERLLPLMLRALGTDPSTAAARGLLGTWLAHGAHRIDRNRDGRYDDGTAIALFDAWYARFAAAFVAGLPPVPASLDDPPSSHVGSAWDNVAAYGWIDTDLRGLLGLPVAAPFHRHYCGDGTLAGCQTVLASTLGSALAALGPDPSTWPDPAAQDAITFVHLGLGFAQPITWQNRPTFQQVVSFHTHL